MILSIICLFTNIKLKKCKVEPVSDRRSRIIDEKVKNDNLDKQVKIILYT
jgi:hypothetical protein